MWFPAKKLLPYGVKNNIKNFNFFIMLLLSSCSINENQRGEAIITSYKPHQSCIDPSSINKTVLVGGCFDILHYGHIEFLKKAKAAGDFLIVALEPDEKIIQLKKRMPIHNQQERAQNLAAIRYVDQVIILPYLQGFEEYNQLVADIKPKVLAITADDPCVQKKQMQAENVGAKLTIVTEKIKDFSSAKIYNASLKPNLFFKGVVIEGKKIASTLGYPTANIHINSQSVKEGVYSCYVLIDNHLYQGMSYYDKKRPDILETHVFDYSNNLYGKEILVILKNFLRKPKENLTLHMLKKLINQDAIACKNDL